ncbi:hypothetical protein OCU04_009793 [Sclerotinia nivalis]|uniref:mitogen-activated protein kinase n=1 Tax=Sclerotinia nivalis TaxID=352851 RepID=A0A9X0DFW0_9HELO|nr:hypothetical protein OCU04_009793 [Sclerotinia nivalis]
MAETIKKYDALPYGRVENPRLARTVDEEPTNFPSRMKTRPHTPMPRQLKIRYVKVGPPLGSGMFGTVHKVIDVDSGKFMAVKIIEHKVSKQQPLYNVLKREVEALSRLGHPHIVNYIASQGWDEPQLEIFMGLKEGSLNSLIESGVDVSEVANSVFPQMLKALDFIACKGIVHRDVKPDNILFISQPEGQYQFHLGDFGLCNRIADAKTFAGTSIYMAPEMLHGGAQTHKVDVWSLFVTMLWILDAGGLRQKCNEFTHVSEVQRAVLFIASNPGPISSIREMAIINSVERASAAQMLVKHFDGAGLSTPRNQVPALIISPSATAKAPLSAPFNKKSRIPQRRPEKLRMHGNIFGNSRHKNPHKSRQIKPASQLQGILPKPTDQELDC